VSPPLKRLVALTVGLALCACDSSESLRALGLRETAAQRQSVRTVAVCDSGGRGSHCGALLRTDVKPSASKVSGYGPADLEQAYNLPSTGDGTGQIVAIVDAYDNPSVSSDLAAYRSAFGLPAATFTKYNQLGQTKNYPTGNTEWGVEIDLDVDMVSAACPNCTIYLIEANSNSSSDLETAEAEAVSLGAHIVSNSFGGTNLKQSDFDTKGVTYLASSGSDGSGVSEPAAFDTVVAVGGTSLTRGGGGKRGWTESSWPGGGGGCTTFPKPPWQHDPGCAFRLANDVSAVADPNPGVAEYDTYGYGGWLVTGGTSVSTPLLAGVFGLAGNATKQDGGRTFWETAHHPYLYRVESGGKYVRYSTASGWGSPDGVGAF
jgi:subtilase family serine protease